MPDYSIITNNIIIGNAYSVIGNHMTRERDILDKMNVKVVISILTEEEYEDYMIGQEDFEDIEWYRLVLDDDKEEPISQYFTLVHSIIKKAIQNKNTVIIHCAAGISRSPTLVAAYFIIENGWTSEEALFYIKNRRPYVDPNSGFIRQLELLQSLQ
jgi:protein-tyrosine phosphatase